MLVIQLSHAELQVLSAKIKVCVSASHHHQYTCHTITSPPVTPSPAHLSYHHQHTCHTITSTPVIPSPVHLLHHHQPTSHTITSTPVTPSPAHLSQYPVKHFAHLQIFNHPPHEAYEVFHLTNASWHGLCT